MKKSIISFVFSLIALFLFLFFKNQSNFVLSLIDFSCLFLGIIFSIISLVKKEKGKWFLILTILIIIFLASIIFYINFFRSDFIPAI